jgi:membrane protein
MRSIWDLMKAAWAGWRADFASSMGAALAYYTVFSIAPLLVIVIAIAALAFGHAAAQEQILAQARDLLGAQGAGVLESMLASARKPGQGIFASVLSLAALVFGAIGVFNELESDLNRIWKVSPDAQAGIRGMVRARLLSFGMVLAIGFLLLVSLAVSAALAAWGSYWSGAFAGIEVLLHAANFVVSFAVVSLLFALMYKFLPATPIAWRDVWIGGAVTALLFTIGKLLIGLYLGKSSIASTYGAAGSLVILLLWVYYSAQIFLFGAEFTRAYAQRQHAVRDAGSSSDLASARAAR